MEALRVMVVDDYLPNAQMVSFILESAGLSVLTVESAQAALDQIPAFAPQLILMDIQLPGMDGLQLTQTLKADPLTRHIVITAFTAYAMKGDREKMLAAGCDGYIAKPIDVHTIAQSISDIWAAKRPRPADASA